MLDLTKYDLWYLLYHEQNKHFDANLKAIREGKDKPYSNDFCEGFQLAMNIISDALLEKEKDVQK